MTDDYVAQLSLLRAIATGTLPRVADGYAQVSRDIEGARGEASSAMGKSYGPWEELAGSLQDAAAEVSDDMYACGETLFKASNDFARQDNLHAETLDDYKKKIKVATQELPRPVRPKHEDYSIHTDDITQNDNPNMYGGQFL